MNQNFILTPIPVADLMAQMRDIVRDELRQQQRADQSEKLLTPKETADLLRVSVVTIWQWEKQGRIVKHSMGGRTYFKYGELMASIETLNRYRKPNLVRRATAA